MPALAISNLVLETNRIETFSEFELTKKEAAPEATKQTHPLLFIPGAFTGAWLWEFNFMHDFAELGYDCYAMSFRGHGKNRLQHGLNSLEDHLEDLRLAIDEIDGDPILVGYSLGGLVLYKHLLSNTAPGAIMLSAIPPYGVLDSFFDLAVSKPMSAIKLASLAIFPAVRHFGSPPEGIYSNDIDPAVADDVTKQLRGEPLAALVQSAFSTQRKDEIKPITHTPLKLYGATGDHIIPAKEVIRSAELLEAPYTIFEGMSHSMMAEPDADIIVEDVKQWLSQESLFRA